jgi:hypothetical protein
MNFLKIILCLGVITIVGACEAKNAGQAKQEAVNAIKAGSNPAGDKATYVSPCVSSTLPDVGALKFPGTKTVYELSLLNFSKKQFYYTDGDCATEAIVVQESGTESFNGSAQSDQPAQVDFNFVKTSVKVQSQELANLFSTFKICGIDNWTVGTDTDVTAQSTQMTCPGKPSPRTAQDLVFVKDNFLYLGADSNQAQRPDHVDMTKGFVKQP